MVDARDLKSLEVSLVRVRFPPQATFKINYLGLSIAPNDCADFGDCARNCARLCPPIQQFQEGLFLRSRLF